MRDEELRVRLEFALLLALPLFFIASWLAH